MLPEIPLEELSAALDAVAAKALAAAQIAEPPVDAMLIARRLGLTVAWDDRQAGRARIVKLSAEPGAQMPSILLRHDPRLERQHWAVAHEIGEALAEQVFARLSVDPREAPRQVREHVANGLASRLLLPRDRFGQEGIECGWDLFALKQRYSTASHELIARRMLDFPPPVIISLYDQNRKNWRKTNIAGRLPPPSQREFEMRLQAHETGQPMHDDGPPAIHVWPIHEPPWQREIIRVEVDEFAAE